MTTIYTKPQIDAMAVKIGGEIKAAKTPVAWGNITGNIADQLDLTQRYYTKVEVTEQLGYFGTVLEDLYVKGAYYNTTTAAYPNVNIAEDGALSRSTATFGTAASKDVGEVVGNVMEVGAFGWGGASAKNYGDYALEAPREELLKTQKVSYGGVAGYGYPVGIGWSAGNDRAYSIVGSSASPALYLVSIGDTNTAPSSSERTASIRSGSFLILGMNATKDANGFLRDSNSTAETVAADASGNLPVASIQAGIGAPKIAYKRFMETSPSSDTGSVEIPHGLNGDDILDVSVWIKRNTSEWCTVNFSSTGIYFTVLIKATTITVRNITGSSLINKPMKILITYEVN